MGGMHFRRANEGDLERLVAIHASAFPDPRRDDARRTNFTSNAFGELADLRVCEIDSVIVAHAFLFSLEIGVGGARVRAGGIASVGVAPEARGSGVGGALLDHLHAQSQKRNDAITVLYAFRQGFYARRGYVAVTPSRRLHFSPRAVPTAWRKEGLVRRATGEDRDAIVACYERAVLRGTGLISRTSRFWDARLLDERRQWFVAPGERGEIRGYVAWTTGQREPHAVTTMAVNELVADDDRTKRRLYALIGAQRDQVSEVVIEVDAVDPIDRALEDADQGRFGNEDLEHFLGEIAAGPMVRMLDVDRAIAARGYAREGAVNLVIDGGDVRRVEIGAGRGRVVAPTPRAAEGPTLRASAAALAQILYGALATTDAARLGWVEADAASTLDLADGLFAIPPYFALDPF